MYFYPATIFSKYSVKKNVQKKIGLQLLHKWVMLTWLKQDDRMNMTEIGEHDQKIHTDEC